MYPSRLFIAGKFMQSTDTLRPGIMIRISP
jgi:hypothetical protein